MDAPGPIVGLHVEFHQDMGFSFKKDAPLDQNMDHISPTFGLEKRYINNKYDIRFINKNLVGYPQTNSSHRRIRKERIGSC